jgi:hypothetical protein
MLSTVFILLDHHPWTPPKADTERDLCAEEEVRIPWTFHDAAASIADPLAHPSMKMLSYTGANQGRGVRGGNPSVVLAVWNLPHRLDLIPSFAATTSPPSAIAPPPPYPLIVAMTTTATIATPSSASSYTPARTGSKLSAFLGLAIGHLLSARAAAEEAERVVEAEEVARLAQHAAALASLRGTMAQEGRDAQDALRAAHTQELEVVQTCIVAARNTITIQEAGAAVLAADLQEKSQKITDLEQQLGVANERTELEGELLPRMRRLLLLLPGPQPVPAGPVALDPTVPMGAAPAAGPAQAAAPGAHGCADKDVRPIRALPGAKRPRSEAEATRAPVTGGPKKQKWT